jgi:hypothetical protein
MPPRELDGKGLQIVDCINRIIRIAAWPDADLWVTTAIDIQPAERRHKAIRTAVVWQPLEPFPYEAQQGVAKLATPC